jgi:hypothetical protein
LVINKTLLKRVKIIIIFSNRLSRLVIARLSPEEMACKDEISYNVDCQNPIQQRWNDNFYQRPHQQDSYSPIAVPPKIARNYSWEQNIESMSKLNEFKIMLSKYCSPQDTWQLSFMASYLLSRGNDDFIDEWLSLLRKKTEMDHSVASWQR